LRGRSHRGHAKRFAAGHSDHPQPADNLPVSTEKLFNSKTNHCFGGATTETTYGRYRDLKSSECLADKNGSGNAGSLPVLETCNSGPAEDLAFDGAVLGSDEDRYEI
jgi:hypothetical protein